MVRNSRVMISKKCIFDDSGILDDVGIIGDELGYLMEVGLCFFDGST